MPPLLESDSLEQAVVASPLAGITLLKEGSLIICPPLHYTVEDSMPEQAYPFVKIEPKDDGFIPEDYVVKKIPVEAKQPISRYGSGSAHLNQGLLEGARRARMTG